MEATVTFDPATGQIVVSNIQSRMSLDEAEALALALTLEVTTHRLGPPRPAVDPQ